MKTKPVTRFAPNTPRTMGFYSDVRAFTTKTTPDGKAYGVGVVRYGWDGKTYTIVVGDKSTREIVTYEIDPVAGEKTATSYQMPLSIRNRFNAIRKMNSEKFQRFIERHKRV